MPTGNVGPERAAVKVAAADISTTCWRCDFRRSPCCGQRSLCFDAFPLPFHRESRRGALDPYQPPHTPLSEDSILVSKKNYPLGPYRHKATTAPTPCKPS